MPCDEDPKHSTAASQDGRKRKDLGVSGKGTRGVLTGTIGLGGSLDKSIMGGGGECREGMVLYLVVYSTCL